MGQSITSIGDLNALLLAAADNDIIHIDECHELDKQFQTALYLAIDKRTIFVNSKRSPQPIPIADFTLLLSTTDEYCLLAPLRDRMKLTLRFEYYSEEELTSCFATAAKALGWPIDDKVLPLIAQRARGVPRLALRLFKVAAVCAEARANRRFSPCISSGPASLSKSTTWASDHWNESILRSWPMGRARLNVISTILGLPTRTVAEVTEQFLIRSGLIDKDKNGMRQLTAKGLEHVRSK